MKLAAVTILTILTLVQALRTQIKQNSKELDKLAYVLFPTTVFYLVMLGAI